MKDIFKKVAELENVSEEEVKSEISEAIRLAMKSDNQNAKALWNEIAPDGKEPSPEEVIEKIAFLIKKRKFYIS